MDSLQVAGHPSIAQDSAGSAHGAPAHTLRPTVVRRDTELILSYYQSADAGRAYSPPVSQDHHLNGIHRRQMSSGSTSPSDYSDDEGGFEVRPTRGTRQEKQAIIGEGHRRQRSSARSDGGEDKRRIALVQVESSPFPNGPDSSSPKRSESSRTVRNPSPGLLSRRGMGSHLKGLALVAPPDASPKSYTDLTPPPSAPVEGTMNGNSGFPPPSGWGHQRSASEVPRASKNGSIRRKSSRDVGIVGTGNPSSRPYRSPSHRTLHDRSQTVEGSGRLETPIFLTPQSRSPTPGAAQGSNSESAHPRVELTQGYPTQEDLSPQNRLGSTTPLLTPGIGQGKEIHEPVAGPVVVTLKSQVRGAGTMDSPKLEASPSPSPSPHPTNPPDFSAYLSYEPGVHSTAGPLPPPPRAVFDIDPQSAPPPRPPRLHSPPPLNPRRRPDMDPVRQPMQISDAMGSLLRPEGSRVSLRREYSDFSIMAVSVHSGDEKSSPDIASDEPDTAHAYHHREGAFPTSTFIQSPVGRRGCDTDTDSKTVDSDNAPSSSVTIGSNGPMQELEVTTPTMTINPPEEDVQEANLHHTRSFTSLGHEFSHLQISSPGGMSISSHSESHGTEDAPHQRAMTIGAGFPSELVARMNLKRFSSLPRTPSGASSSAVSSRTSSPNLPPQPAPRPKIVSRWPNAMYYGDVVAKRSGLDRAMGYAQKINELAMHDCGLGAWAMAKRHPGGAGGSGSRVVLSPTGPSVPSTMTQFGQPRHTSAGSQGSEMTFPRRLDAYLATDLSTRPTDDLPTGPPPSLPYPSLATTPSTPSHRLSALPLSSPTSPRSLPSSLSKSPATTFFSSIGRKTSIKKERGQTLGSPGKLLTKPPPNTPPAPRPVQIQNAPSVPGGPRAPPGRVRRSQTVAVGVATGPSTDSSLQSPPSSVTRRQSSTVKRPSFFAVSRSAPSRLPDPDFEKQLDKLADLLPQADRNVLAGYLRRSGQDIVAIGQYLEDEKNGTIRRD